MNLILADSALESSSNEPSSSLHDENHLDCCKRDQNVHWTLLAACWAQYKLIPALSSPLSLWLMLLLLWAAHRYLSITHKLHGLWVCQRRAFWSINSENTLLDFISAWINTDWESMCSFMMEGQGQRDRSKRQFSPKEESLSVVLVKSTPMWRDTVDNGHGATLGRQNHGMSHKPARYKFGIGICIKPIAIGLCHIMNPQSFFYALYLLVINTKKNISFSRVVLQI